MITLFRVKHKALAVLHTLVPPLGDKMSEPHARERPEQDKEKFSKHHSEEVIL